MLFTPVIVSISSGKSIGHAGKSQKSSGSQHVFQMKVVERIRCRGHENIRGTHPTTFQITTEPALSPRGDCVIGVCADKGLPDLGDEFRVLLAKEGAILVTRLEAGGVTVRIQSMGSSLLSLDHPTDLVWRRSSFICSRTVGISSDQTARTLPRDLISLLREKAEMTVTMTVYPPEKTRMKNSPVGIPARKQ